MMENHEAHLEISKYVLIHFIRNHRRATSASIIMKNVIIDSVNEVKYLDVIFDQKLQFKAHLQYIVKKDISAALASRKTAEECIINMHASYSKQSSQHVRFTQSSSSIGQKMIIK